MSQTRNLYWFIRLLWKKEAPFLIVRDNLPYHLSHLIGQSNYVTMKFTNGLSLPLTWMNWMECNEWNTRLMHNSGLFAVETKHELHTSVPLVYHHSLTHHNILLNSTDEYLAELTHKLSPQPQFNVANNRKLYIISSASWIEWHHLAAVILPSFAFIQFEKFHILSFVRHHHIRNDQNIARH